MPQHKGNVVKFIVVVAITLTLYFSDNAYTNT